jgi:hypothetical protein
VASRIPVIVPDGEPEEQFEAVKEIVEIAHRQRGLTTDSFVTVQDLVNLGIVKVDTNGKLIKL